jgi:multisubunit Na+/H+ antiporter MnhB subunit
MKSGSQPKKEIKYDYGTILLMAVLLLGVSQSIEGIQTPTGSFIRGVVIGMSIACSVIGLIFYGLSSKKR